MSIIISTKNNKKKSYRKGEILVCIMDTEFGNK